MNKKELDIILKKHHKWLNDEADGKRADLRGADLRRADLEGADLRRAENLPFIPLVCPEKGSFTAFKKGYYNDGDVVIELEIPEDAKRLSGTSRKCRASKAIVKAMYTRNDEGKYVLSDETTAHGWHDSDFIYKVGETVIPDSFDENRWKECSNGIHFFMSFHEAAEW